MPQSAVKQDELFYNFIKEFLGNTVTPLPTLFNSGFVGDKEKLVRQIKLASIFIAYSVEKSNSLIGSWENNTLNIDKNLLWFLYAKTLHVYFFVTQNPNIILNLNETFKLDLQALVDQHFLKIENNQIQLAVTYSLANSHSTKKRKFTSNAKAESKVDNDKIIKLESRVDELQKQLADQGHTIKLLTEQINTLSTMLTGSNQMFSPFSPVATTEQQDQESLTHQTQLEIHSNEPKQTIVTSPYAIFPNIPASLPTQLGQISSNSPDSTIFSTAELVDLLYQIPTLTSFQKS